MAETKSYKMDLPDLTKIVVCRIQKLDPDNVSKIMGFILLKEPCEEDMLKLAFGPESTLISIIDEAKKILGFLSPNNPSITSDHNLAIVDSIREKVNSLSTQAQLLNLEEKIDSSSSMGNQYYCQDTSFDGSLSLRTSSRSPSLPEFPITACHYFYKGYCKHGANCRYYHDQSFLDGYYQALCSNYDDLKIEENGLSPKSLEKLEMEILDLLKSRNGAPVSIFFLPLLYYEKYGKTLQVDGYLTESHRHGKAGFSLTKLLACLTNSIRLIHKPHGQHSIILAKDAQKYLECRHERSETIGTSMSSHQIYLTFPADSTFNEDDVSSYFNLFGPVKDVRIPSQEKRMYGFVNFLHSETVGEILMKRNVHYICGSRVLVKPYKAKKSRIVDRTYIRKNEPSMHYPYQNLDLESEPSGIPMETSSSGTIKLHIELQQKMIELERSQLARFNLAQELIDQKHYNNNYGVDESKLIEDPNHNSFEDYLGFSFDVLNTGSSGFVETKDKSNNSSDKESGHIELPDNPFSIGGSF